MALQTKSIVGNGARGHHRFTLTVTENSTNVDTNTSNVSFSFVLSYISPYSGFDWVYSSTIPVSYSININGETYSGNIMKYDGVSTVTVKTGNIPSLKHNDDGSKTISYSFSVSSLSASYLPGAASASGSMELTYIPRASTITCTPADIGSRPTITISRASNSFTHSVSYAFGSLKGDIALKTSATSITNWTIPEEFYKQIPNAPTGKGTLTCITYSGNTPIGDPQQCELSVTTNETICKPTVYGWVVDINPRTIAATGNESALVRFCSTALCEMGVTLNKSAGSVLTKTINNIVVDQDDAVEIPNVGSAVFDFYAQDSRKYHNTTKVVVDKFIPYIMLTANVEASREEPTANSAKLTIEGNYFKGNFGAKDNTLTVMYRQKGASAYSYATPTISTNEDKYSVTVDLPNLEYTKSFEYEVVVEDAVTTITKPATIQKGIPVFDWGEEDFNFNVPVTINGVNILEKLAELERLVKG